MLEEEIENGNRTHSHSEHHHHKHEEEEETTASEDQTEVPADVTAGKDETTTEEAQQSLRRTHQHNEHKHNQHKEHKEEAEVVPAEGEVEADATVEEPVAAPEESQTEQSLRRTHQHKEHKHNHHKEHKEEAEVPATDSPTAPETASETTQEASLISLKSQHNKTHHQNTTTTAEEESASSDLVDAVNKEPENNSETDLKLIKENGAKPAKSIKMLQVKCFDSCVDECKKNYSNNELEMKNCAAKACKCDSTDIANITFTIIQPATWGSLIIDSLIVMSLISLATSIVMIGILMYKRRENSTDKYENQYDSINLDFSREICEEKIDARIFESHYELMTTEVEEADYKEICIRDF